ncbi:hypothetical protein B0A55_01911 [Friedmanniomyces simplex]|uniref:Ecp2 effector protein domain-containing protein n=1 Tax=Friedmanniomyces simplex TaxID=329884 RepID=A0A4V5NHU1_9PEZI|nr:hypothetical protein B0A55_01911 [Friedmanniomyces simplex]
MQVLVLVFLYTALSNSAPITGNEVLQTASGLPHVAIGSDLDVVSAATLAKGDGLIACNVGGVTLEAEWQVRNAIQGFCTNNGLGSNKAVAKPAAQNPTVLFPIMATYYENDVHEQLNHITLSIANNSPTTPYTVGYNDCLNALLALNDACTAAHTGGTWFAENVFWSYDINNAAEGFKERSIGEVDGATMPTEFKRAVDSSAVAAVAPRDTAPTATCQVTDPGNILTTRIVVTAAFSQFCGINNGVHIPFGGSVNQIFTLEGNFGNAIFGIDVMTKTDEYVINFEGCMGLFTTILNDCGKDGSEWAVGGVLSLPGGWLNYIIDINPGA